MRADEFLLESEVVREIERIRPSSYSGGKEELKDLKFDKVIKKLPGGSGLLYSITNDGSDVSIKLWDQVNKGEFQPTEQPTKQNWMTNRTYKQYFDRWVQKTKKARREFNRAPGKLIGELTLHKPYRFPIKNALQVGTITVDEDYRGRGLATAMYGVVLTIMRRPLLAGSSQTPGGRRNWVSLANIPGVEMKGYFRLDSSDLQSQATSGPGMDRYDIKWAKAHNKQIDTRIDTIMGKLGGQYIGRDVDREYFAFDVKPTTSKEELKAYVDTNLNQVYTNHGGATGLMAVWTGKRHR